MSDVFDLDAIPTDGKPPFRFLFDGEEYECASPDSLDVRDLKALIEDAQNDPAAQLAWMLGEEGWARLEAAEKVFTIKHLNVVTEQWLAHHGVDLPKSGGSAKSSTKRQIR